MKIKMNVCASAKNFLYNHGAIYEVGKELTEAMAKSFIEVGFATIVEEDNKENSPKPKKTVRKKKNED